MGHLPYNMCQFSTFFIWQNSRYYFFSSFRTPWGHYDPLVTNRVDFIRLNLLINVSYTKACNPCQFSTFFIWENTSYYFFFDFRAPWGRYDPLVTTRVNFVRPNLLRNVCYTKTYYLCQFSTLLVETTRVINFFWNFIARWVHFDPLVTNKVNFVRLNLLINIFYTKACNPCQFSTFFIWANTSYYFFSTLELHGVVMTLW